MKRIFFMLLLTGMSLVACAPRADEVEERAMEMAQELAQDVEAYQDTPESAPVQGSDGAEEYTTWGALALPPQFPEFTDGKILTPGIWQDWYPKILGIENTSVQAIEAYVQRALDQGYTLQWEREIMGDEDLGWAVSMETDTEVYGIILSFYEDNYGIPNYLNLLLDVREK